MSGSRLGGLKAAEKNKLRHGPDFYKRIGKIGGTRGTMGGFASDVRCYCPIVEGRHFKRNCAGTIGGRISRRSKKGYEAAS